MYNLLNRQSPLGLISFCEIWLGNKEGSSAKPGFQGLRTLKFGRYGLLYGAMQHSIACHSTLARVPICIVSDPYYAVLWSTP